MTAPWTGQELPEFLIEVCRLSLGRIETMKSRIHFAAATAALSLPLFLAAHAFSTQAAQASGSDEFFIISSVDIKQNQIVLKRPTEVTQVVTVNKETVFLNLAGKTMPFATLRAGDTGYAMLKRVKGEYILAKFRLAPMTLEEVHKRYLSFSTE